MQATSRTRLLELATLTACVALGATTPFLSSALSAQRPKPAELDERIYVPSPGAARVAVAGYNQLAADLVWSRTLVYYGDSILNAKSFADLDGLIGLINALDPQFRRPYAWGGHAAAFRVGEIPQSAFWMSAMILTRAVHAFPNDWEFAWTLGLRYYLDLNPGVPDLRKGLQNLGVSYLERAMRMPDAPGNLANLAASLRTKLGQTEQAMRNLREMAMTTTDPEARQVLLTKYSRIAGEGAAAALAEAGETFNAEWQATLPYAPDSLFVLVGEAPAWSRPAQLAARGDLRHTLLGEPEEALGDGEQVAPADAPTPPSGDEPGTQEPLK